MRRYQSNIQSRQLPFVGRDDPLKLMSEKLCDPTQDNVLVLWGQAGVGKSELARAFARQHRDRYPGGTFFIDARSAAITIELAKIGKIWLGLDFPIDFSLEDQALRTLSVLFEEASLLIFDNAQSETSIRPWLPPAGMPCHVLITSIIDFWNQDWPVISVRPLSETASLDLIDKMGIGGVPDQLRLELAAQSQGLPVQIVPMSRALRRASSRGRVSTVKITLSEEAAKSFGGVYGQLGSSACVLIHAAARLNHQRIIKGELKNHLLQSFGWSDEEFERHLDTCIDLAVLEGDSEMRMHQLFSTYILEHSPEGLVGIESVIRSQGQRLVQLAEQLLENPNQAEIASTFATYPLRIENWTGYEKIFSASQLDCIGGALMNIGQFDAARSWFERAVTEKEADSTHPFVDYDSLGISQHYVGFCFSCKGKFELAQPWFERAIASKKKGNSNRVVDYESLGKSQHSLGFTFSRAGRWDIALPWFELAVKSKENGDGRGLVDQQSVSESLHQVGICLRRAGNFNKAQSWFERAVARKQAGDSRGRVDHQSVGMSMHQIGVCLVNASEGDMARLWFELAVAEKRLGDIHGRINHSSLSLSLYHVGICLRTAHQLQAALSHFEDAVRYSEMGDVHGRIDSELLRENLRSLENCLYRLEQPDQAAAVAMRIAHITQT